MSADDLLGRAGVTVAALWVFSALATSAESQVWPVENGQVLSQFHAPHEGLDIAAAPGTPVLAYANGVVTTRDVTRHCGQRVRLQHAAGTVTLYCNLSDVNVELGETVLAGTPLGKIATPAKGTRPHLHFELKIGERKVDPLAHLPRAPA